MRWIGQGIAFSALVAGAAALEITGHEAGWLWIVVVVWALFGDWKT